MSKHYNVADAKAQLSRLLDAAIAGEDVVVSRAGKPLVRLVPVQPPRRRETGFLPMHIPDGAFDPLPPDELARWS